MRVREERLRVGAALIVDAEGGDDQGKSYIGDLLRKWPHCRPGCAVGTLAQGSACLSRALTLVCPPPTRRAAGWVEGDERTHVKTGGQPARGSCAAPLTEGRSRIGVCRGHQLPAPPPSPTFCPPQAAQSPRRAAPRRAQEATGRPYISPICSSGGRSVAARCGQRVPIPTLRPAAGRLPAVDSPRRPASSAIGSEWPSRSPAAAALSNKVCILRLHRL